MANQSSQLIRRMTIVALVFCGLFLFSGVVKANDYLEKKKHYMAYSAGIDKVHFKIPVWAYGAVNNYYLDFDSRIYYVKDGQEHTIANFKSDTYDENSKSGDKGTAYVKLANGMGSITVTSMADGAPYYVTDNGEWTPRLIVVQREDDDYKQVTFLEFDWYQPASMYGSAQVELKIHVDIRKSAYGDRQYAFDWSFGQFKPGESLTTPQLFTPYLYALNENGITGYGNAGIPYAVHYEPKNYTVSVAPTVVKKLSNSERSGNIFVMTTDTINKEIAVTFDIDGKTVTLGGMSKGSGMIHPNMCTMLGFLTTDLSIEKKLLQEALSEVVKDTFNMITVDGDTSTNDTLLIMANGLAGNAKITEKNDAYKEFYDALSYVCRHLARTMAGDGEGATKLFEAKVINAKSKDDARTLSRAIVGSNLSKAAIYGCDANFGRFLCAMGYSGAQFDQNDVELFFESDAGRLQVFDHGVPLAFDEEIAKRIMQASEVTVFVDMHEGEAEATAWGCDLTYDYVKINADYRS